MTTAPMVIVLVKANGDFDVLASGDVRLIWVDENATAPAERIFEQTIRVPPSVLIDLLGADAVETNLEPKPGRPRPNLRYYGANARAALGPPEQPAIAAGVDSPSW
jgi:hypothetical protein